MEIDKNQIQRLAHLSRLSLTEAEETRMISSMNNILSWMDKLRQVNTDGITPMTNMSHEVDALRNDEISQAATYEQAFACAPQHNGEYFIVPKVIE